MRIAVTFAAPLVLADGPLGTRRVLRVVGGTVEGPALAGAVLEGGGDWVLARRDGAAELDIRFMLESQAGELVYLRATGLFVASDDVAARVRAGAAVPPDAYYFRTAMLFEAAAPRLRGLTHALHVGVGQRTATGMVTDVFAVS